MKKINVYSISELKTKFPEAYEKVIRDNYDINIDHNWWDFIYDDAEQIECHISGFDLERNEIEFNIYPEPAEKVAYKIKKNHGNTCGTYKAACNFLEKAEPMMTYAAIDNDQELYETAEYIELEKEFEKELSECYLQMLKQEFDYYTSEEGIYETIEANDYHFTRNGTMVTI